MAPVGGNPPEYVELGDYYDLTMTAGYTLGKDHRTRIYGEIDNVFDNRYSTVAGYPDFGRQFLIGLRHRL